MHLHPSSFLSALCECVNSISVYLISDPDGRSDRIPTLQFERKGGGLGREGEASVGFHQELFFAVDPHPESVGNA